jgi:hypothetical protein
MLRSIFHDDELTIETVICKVYFPQCEATTYSQTWPTSACELKSQNNKEIRRFTISSNKSFGQFFDIITSSIVEPSAEVELLYLDSNSDWVPVRDNNHWTRALTSARRVSDQKQLRVKVTTRDGSSVTPKPTSLSPPRQKSKKNTCCIVPTKTEAYSAVSSSNFLSIKQDFGDVQKQLQVLQLQHQGQQPEKRRKKKVNSEKKSKRSAKNAPAEIVSQVVYSEHFAFMPSKWGSGTHGSSASIAVL